MATILQKKKKKKKTKSIDGAAKFAVSSYRHLIYRAENKGYVEAHEFIDGLVKKTFRLMKKDVSGFPTSSAYSSCVPLNSKKLNDLRKLLQYIPDKHRPFYEKLLEWPTTDMDNEEEL